MTHWSQTITGASRPKVKFFGNFRDELEKTLISLEIAIEKTISEIYSIDSIIR
jgi:molybdopterin converting factor small subunit